MSEHHTHSNELSAEAMNEYVSVRIGDQLFGAPVDQIREVFAPQSVTHVPRAPDEVAGLLNLRGRIVTAIDARRRMGLPVRRRDARGKIGCERLRRRNRPPGPAGGDRQHQDRWKKRPLTYWDNWVLRRLPARPS